MCAGVSLPSHAPASCPCGERQRQLFSSCSSSSSGSSSCSINALAQAQGRPTRARCRRLVQMWKRERHVIASTSRRVRSLRRRLGVGAEGASDTVAENTFSAAAHTRHVTLTMRTGRPVRELRIGRAPLYWLLWTHSRGFFARWHSWKLCVSNRFRFRGCYLGLRSAAGPRKSLRFRANSFVGRSFGADGLP